MFADPSINPPPINTCQGDSHMQTQRTGFSSFTFDNNRISTDEQCRRVVDTTKCEGGGEGGLWS